MEGPQASDLAKLLSSTVSSGHALQVPIGVYSEHLGRHLAGPDAGPAWQTCSLQCQGTSCPTGAAGLGAVLDLSSAPLPHRAG